MATKKELQEGLKGYAAEVKQHIEDSLAEEMVAEDIFVKSRTGYTKTELTKAFELVQVPHDWKAPIASYCTTDEVKIVATAIEFFTATKAHFDYIGVRDSDADRFHKGDHIMKVRATGYRMGPAGDH